MSVDVTAVYLLQKNFVEKSFTMFYHSNICICGSNFNVYKSNSQKKKCIKITQVYECQAVNVPSHGNLCNTGPKGVLTASSDWDNVNAVV